jgi:hypothetical protein
MIKFTKTICATSLLATLSWAGIASAENAFPIGTFRGGGYEVTSPFGGDYMGCDRQGRKIVIPSSQRSSNGKTVKWTNKGFTYSLTGVGNSLAGPNGKGVDPEDSNDYRKVALTIANPQGRVILSQILNNPYYGRK